ncbi:hypothetical protein ONS95_003241 [Cadophora gregata]|uniref:uncharacterized protein n=1 Tax=Cadophora gregata TaxID=51156 RepID=UPI0026DB3E57|nr:uncharacterized protein ONS95_003241 [Cadophora gregata]KAK0108438.1 hypothetical protein ONS95_003241 [Cadophora gregata]KAK0108969.1 hypothetical protein ONS96_002807 [Cadophora gregata f. sp. sojae]
MARFALYPPHGLGLSEFLSALEATVQRCPILRTRIILTANGTSQVVLNDKIRWLSAQERPLTEIVRLVPPAVAYGTPLSFFTLAEDEDRGACVVWNIHHTLYDGFAFRQMVRVIQNACGISGNIANPIPLSNYVKFVQSCDPAETRSYWESQLEGAQATIFPPKSITSSDLQSGDYLTHLFHIPDHQATDITICTLLRSAWALVVSRHVESTDVVLACTISGRSAPVSDIQNIAGPTIATVPVRVQIKHEDTVSEFLAMVRQQSNDMIRYEHTGLQNIRRLQETAREACTFRSQLIIQPGEIFRAANTPDLGYDFVKDLSDVSQQFDAYPLVFQCVLGSNGMVEVHALYDGQIVAPRQMQAICDQFEHVVLQLVTEPKRRVSEIDLCGPRDIEQIMEWNSQKPSRLVYSCVHDLISDQARLLGEKVAIQAWDGQFTYSELDKLSTRLAVYLATLGVYPENMVAMCLEKSRWAVIAMLGIMKAGGVFVPLDPTHPESRRRALIETVNAKLIILSPETAPLFSELELPVVTVTEQFALALPDAMPPRSNSPSNAAYIAFSSGSTGTPKGIVVEQAALCSSIIGHGGAYGLGPASRMLQFSTFTFDGSLSEILTPLVFGGTVCMPSDTQRLQDTAKFIRDAQVNVAILTPSFANTLSPDDVPSLNTLILSGEVLVKDQVPYGFFFYRHCLYFLQILSVNRPFRRIFCLYFSQLSVFFSAGFSDSN